VGWGMASGEPSQDGFPVAGRSNEEGVDRFSARTKGGPERYLIGYLAALPPFLSQAPVPLRGKEPS